MAISTFTSMLLPSKTISHPLVKRMVVSIAICFSPFLSVQTLFAQDLLDQKTAIQDGTEDYAYFLD